MTPLVAFSIDGQCSAGTLLRASQLVTTWGEDTPMAFASAEALPRIEIAELRAIQKWYTKGLDMSNALFEPPSTNSSHNLKMDLIKKIDAILESREWGWADLARAMELSEQRVNNWRTRGIPAAQVRNIESALGLNRYALDEEQVEEDEAARVIAEFAYVYRNVTADGRKFLRDMIASVKRSFTTDDKRTK